MIGQSQVTEPLMTALRTGRIGHAYLFSGPRGCGKTTSARILARCLNCVEGPTDTPCGTCPSCVELSRDGGGSLDVVEIDAASHGGVDDARELRERAVFAPARDRFKIFIIDEAHMVTAGGFNALLKIVEEPPPHVKFIFATTEPEKVIGTIRSRTHHYPFRLIPPATLVDYVQSLCDSEGVAVEGGVLPLVVRSGGGSVRDTLSILDQLIAGSEDNRVSASRAAGLLGFTHGELLDDVVAALGTQDSAAAFAATDRVIQSGQDPRRFVEDLLERLRDLIIVNATNIDGASAVLRGVPQDQLARMFEQARAFGGTQLSRTADIVSDALDQMTGATPPRLHLELMIARALVALGATESGVGQAAPGQVAPIQPTQGQPAQNRPVQNQPAPSQPAQGEQTPSQPAQRAPEPPKPEESAKNAAETAASIREFLRNDTAGADAADPAAAAPAAAPAATPAPTSAPPSTQSASQPSTPHPNAGAAGFGRPISEVLSAAQIESIGTQPTEPAKPEPAAPETAKPEPVSTSAPSQADPAVAAVQEPDAVGDADDQPDDQVDDGLPGFEDLLEMWPDLLDELLENNRDAWNAVRVIEPLGLEGDVLLVGIANRSDLQAFKQVGSDPLREAILDATGVRVKYAPRQVSAQRESRDQSAGDRGAQPDSEEPHRGGSSGSSSLSSGGSPNGSQDDEPTVAQHLSDDPMVRAAARLSSLGPALAAPAWADPVEAVADPPAAPAESDQPDAAVEPAQVTQPAQVIQPAPVAQPADEDEPRPLDSDGDPYSDAYGDPYAGMTDAPAPAEQPQQTQKPQQPEQAEAPTPQASPAPANPAPVKTAPAFTRYGESVVREVLGAVFVEERPLPEQRR